LLEPDDELLCIRGPLGTSSTSKRSAGLEEELGSLVAGKTTVFHGDWSAESGERILEGWLAAFSRRGGLPNFVLAAQNDSMAMGARQALVAWFRAHGKPVDHLRILGCDGSPGFGQRLIGTGELTATVLIPSVGSAAIEQATAMQAGGRQPPPEIVIGVRSIPEMDVVARFRDGKSGIH
jgi:ABC-type sugar transport system substrate-binding protein